MFYGCVMKINDVRNDFSTVMFFVYVVLSYFRSLFSYLTNQKRKAQLSMSLNIVQKSHQSFVHRKKIGKRKVYIQKKIYSLNKIYRR